MSLHSRNTCSNYTRHRKYYITDYATKDFMWAVWQIGTNISEEHTASTCRTYLQYLSIKLHRRL